MTLGETLISVWQQTLIDSKSVIELDGRSYRVKVFEKKNLRNVEFPYGKDRFIGIEQNPATNSQWAALARHGKRIMQFRCENRYVANVCEGELKQYPAWKSLELPD